MRVPSVSHSSEAVLELGVGRGGEAPRGGVDAGGVDAGRRGEAGRLMEGCIAFACE